MNFNFQGNSFPIFFEHNNNSPFKKSFQNDLESFEDKSCNSIEENINNFIDSPKQNLTEEKDEIFREKENNSQDDILKLEENDDLDNLPLLKEENYFYKILEIPKIDLGNTKTKYTTKILGQKTKRSDIENTENIKNEQNNGIIKKKQGRKKKEELNKGSHNKQSEDNIMRKIKSYFLNYCHNLLNESLKDKDLQFLKLSCNINENLKRDYNINLLNTLIKELYENSSISKKYKRQIKDGFDKNKLIIKKIYEEKEETETIKILNLSYRELFNVFRKNIKKISSELENKIKDISLLNEDKFNNINNFLEEIENQEKDKKESEENIKNYLNDIKKLCIDYEEWFMSKKGRNRTKKEKKN